MAPFIRTSTAAPSWASAVGTHASPITRPSQALHLALVTRPTGRPASTTAAPSPGGVTAPGIYSPEYYDVARMYIEAFKAGDKTRDAITSYFDSVDYQGLTKTYKFGSNHELAPTDVRIFIWKVDSSTWVNTGQDKDVIPGCAHCSEG